MVWKTDGNDIGQKSRIWLLQVEENGINFVQNSDPILLLEANGSSDGLVVEGQSLIWNSDFGYYYMIFSANGFASPYYHVGAARSRKVNIMIYLNVKIKQ